MSDSIFFRGLTLNEIVDHLNDYDDACDVYIEPPDYRDLSDEDSGGEDDNDEPDIGHLSGNQLLASAKIRCTDVTRYIH